MEYMEMSIEELEKLRSNLINTRQFSNEEMSRFFREQLELSRKMIAENEVNDRLRDQIRIVTSVIEVKKKFEEETEGDA